MAVRGGWLVWALWLLAGCASLPPLPAQPPEQALADVADTPLARMAAAALPVGQPDVSGFRLFFSGESSFNARIALARRAQRSLDLQVFHLAADDTGRGMLAVLRDAAARGVRVRLLIDDLHAPPDEWLAGLAAHPGVQVRLFNPLATRGGPWPLRMLRSWPQFDQLNRRMHNKLFIADNSLAMSGGRNLADGYFMHDPVANFLDLDVLAAGPVVRAMSAVFDRYWNSPLAVPIGLLAEGRPTPELRQAFDAAVARGITRLGERQRDWFGRESFLRQIDRGRLELDEGRVRVVADSPAKAAGAAAPTVAAQALALLASARQEVWLMSPYFIPDAEVMDTVTRLSRTPTADGGRVRIGLLTNSFGATDEPLAYAAYERHRRGLLAAGMAIHELSPTLTRDSGRITYFAETTGQLHAKTFVVDQRWLFVGSLNFDPRSTHLNTEMGLVIDSPVLAQQVSGVIRRAAAFGAFSLRLAGDGATLLWVESDRYGKETVHEREPHDDFWRRLRLWLLRPWVPEALL